MKQVGKSGKIYANDIVESVLDYVRRRYGKFFFFTNRNDPERPTAPVIKPLDYLKRPMVRIIYPWEQGEFWKSRIRIIERQ